MYSNIRFVIIGFYNNPVRNELWRLGNVGCDSLPHYQSLFRFRITIKQIKMNTILENLTGTILIASFILLACRVTFDYAESVLG